MDGSCATRQLRRPSTWRWMILFARFIVSFFALGVFKSQGVFLPYFVDTFSTSTAAAGFAASATVGFGSLVASPFVGALMTVWDARRLSIAGGIFTGIGLVMASFSSSLPQLFASLALTSVGLLICVMPTVKSIMDYFPDEFAFIHGLSLAGGTIGMMVLPPVAEYLVSVYGWRNALRLLGALSFNCVVAGALFRPLATTAQYSPVVTESDAEYSSSTQHRDAESSDKEKANICRTILTQVGERFDVHILTDPVFIIHQLIFILTGVVYSVWHVYLIPHGMALGYGETPSAYLATFGGVGALIGRLGCGIPVDRQILKASTLFITACLVFGASSLLDSVAESSYIALAALATVSGVGMGSIFSLMFVLMREITGDRHMSAYGWLFVSIGAGQLSGGVLAGWIYDVSGGYDTVFTMLGLILITTAAILAWTRCLISCSEKQKQCTGGSRTIFSVCRCCSWA